MLETLYLSMCLQKGPNSPPEPINLEEWDRVSQREAEDSKEGRMAEGLKQERVKEREREGKRDGVRPEGSDERLSWFMFLRFVFPEILSPVLWINNFFCFVTVRKALTLKPKFSNQSRHLQPPYKLYLLNYTRKLFLSTLPFCVAILPIKQHLTLFSP